MTLDQVIKIVKRWYHKPSSSCAMSLIAFRFHSQDFNFSHPKTTVETFFSLYISSPEHCFSTRLSSSSSYLCFLLSSTSSRLRRPGLIGHAHWQCLQMASRPGKSDLIKVVFWTRPGKFDRHATFTCPCSCSEPWFAYLQLVCTEVEWKYWHHLVVIYVTKKFLFMKWLYLLFSWLKHSSWSRQVEPTQRFATHVHHDAGKWSLHRDLSYTFIMIQGGGAYTEICHTRSSWCKQVEPTQRFDTHVHHDAGRWSLHRDLPTHIHHDSGWQNTTGTYQ